MSKDQWSRKMRPNEKGTRGRRSSFTLEELGRIADLLGQPPGWPFITREQLREYIRDLDPFVLKRIREGR